MFKFNLKKAAIYQAIRWSRSFRIIKSLRKLLLALFAILFLLFIYGFLSQAFPKSLLKLLLGNSLISLILAVIAWLKELFFNSKLKQPKIKSFLEEVLLTPSEYNLAEFLSFEVAQAVSRSLKFAKSRRLSEINSSILTHFILKDNPELSFIFSRLVLDLKKVKQIFRDYLKTLKKTNGFEEVYSDDFQETVLKSLEIAQRKGHLRVEVGDILTALAEHDLILKRILIDLKLKVEDVENLTWWLESLEERIAKKKRFWEWENLIRWGSLAKDWATGYTITLDEFSLDLSKTIRAQGFSEIIGHQKEINALERILSRREINNVLLVSEPGVGKKSIALALTQKSVLGELLPEVNYKRVVQLDLSSIATRTESLEEAELILDKIFQEVIRAGNVILVIDEFHNYLGGPVRAGVVNISGVISKYLHFPQFQIVALTTFAGLHKYIEQNPSILSLFEKVEVSKVSEKETLMILEKLVLVLEKKYKRFVSYPALRDIITFSAKYIQDVPFPKKSIDSLDEIMVYASSTKDKIVTSKHVAKIFSEKTEVPVGEVEVKEKKVLLNLEKLIHKRIINQEEAVEEVSAALRRARAEITIRKGPMGTFLFLGPTGVGKTETAKVLAEIYFGSEKRMIRLDMSEFQAVEDIPRLIGSPGQEGLLTTKVREDPFSLVLLDEFEKAHPNILNLFLQVFDEGQITDGLGRKVDFRHTIIIATSNAGYLVILEALKKKILFSEIRNELLDYLFKNRIFRPELINRFDSAIIFKSLTKENLLKIAELLLSKSKKNLKKKDIDFIVTPELEKRIVELGYNPTFGAREMRRVIQDKVENILAEALLREDLKRGDKVKIDPKKFKLIINPHTK